MGIILITVFTVFNIEKIISYPLNKSGYIEKKAIVSEIKKNSQEKGYPCVSISYITNPGYDLGYRYLFWLANVHTTHPDSGAPVYTIVFPLKQIFPTDTTRGAIGLIYPDFKRYNIDKVKESCSGENSNLTDPMFGFTK